MGVCASQSVSFPLATVPMQASNGNLSVSPAQHAPRAWHFVLGRHSFEQLNAVHEDSAVKVAESWYRVMHAFEHCGWNAQFTMHMRASLQRASSLHPRT